MISILSVVTRLRANCPSLAQVDHALTSSAQNAYPAAFVAMRTAQGDEPAFIGVQSQMIRQVISIYYVAERAQTDAPAQQLEAAVAEVMATLRGWQPGPEYQPFSYVGGELDQKDGRACWRDDYQTSHEERLDA